MLSWRLNLLPLSEDEARSAGVNLLLLRGLTALSATMITASAVSMCGQVGWVGLLVPHVCRLALGSDNRRLIPASISLGAAFLVVIDTAARSLTPSEIPISVLTAIIGAPFFIALLRKNGGWEL
jgi:iron complex transport system permease protein